VHHLKALSVVYLKKDDSQAIQEMVSPVRWRWYSLWRFMLLLLLDDTDSQVRCLQNVGAVELEENEVLTAPGPG
jgi:hypothetical protein